MKLDFNIKYQISCESQEEFEIILLKLISVGYIFSDNRFRKIEQIQHKYPHYTIWRYIRVHCNNTCKMVLHSGIITNDIKRFEKITGKEFMIDFYNNSDTLLPQ